MTNTEIGAGDLIVSMGESKLSQVIQTFTGGKHSHAALYNGEGVTEATLPRAQKLTRAQFEAKTQEMSALRHRELFEPFPKQVVENASKYVDLTYNNPNLILTGAISTLSAWVHARNEWAGMNLRNMLGRARPLLGVLKGLMREAPASEQTVEGVTCTELVVRAHLKAGLPIKVRLDPGGVIDFGLLWDAIGEVRTRSGGSIVMSESGLPEDAALAALAEDLRWAEGMSKHLNSIERDPTLQAPVAELKTLVLPVSDDLNAGEDTWYAGLVTPAQLSRSPSFKLLGRIERGTWALGPDDELKRLREH
jgi:hypothetical protein